VLADGLHYAQQLGATRLINAATLTGAIGVALGLLNAGLFSNDDEAVEHFTNGLPVSGEKFWRMPCTDDYREQIKSQIADIMNTGNSRYGGATTAAMFLKEFVGDTPWIHLDIAGTAWIDEQKPWQSKGPSGVAVRKQLQLLLLFLLSSSQRICCRHCFCRCRSLDSTRTHQGSPKGLDTMTLHRLLPAVALALATTAFAQNPAPAAGGPPGGGQRPRGPRPAPTNLKALPKDTTGDQVITLMHQYEGDLGVECEYCHARNPETKRNDFPSDANPVKDKARLMMKMTETINAQYVSTLTDPKPANPVTCGTCHRGMAKPTVFAPLPPPARAPGPPAAPAPPK